VSQTRPDPLVRIAQIVGDFGNPFYDEERQRDVWNEACAFGFQLLLWLTLFTASGVVWVVGGPAVPYVEGALVLLGSVCVLTVAYAHRRGVRITEPSRLLRLRLLPYVALLGVLLVGIGRASADSRASWSAPGPGRWWPWRHCSGRRVVPPPDRGGSAGGLSAGRGEPAGSPRPRTPPTSRCRA
jgi:hypothetical protein